MTASGGFRVLGALFVAALVALVPLNYATGQDKPRQTALVGAIATTYLLVGLLIVERRPGNRVGRSSSPSGRRPADISSSMRSYTSRRRIPLCTSLHRP